MAYPQYGWQTGPATVTTPGSVLNFRPGGGLNYAPFGSIPHGGSVNITGPSTASGGYNWYPVTYGGKTGWVAGQYLTGMPGSAPTTTPTPTPTPSPSPQPMPGLGDIANTVGQYPQNNQQPTGSPYYQGNMPWYYNPASSYGGDRDWASTPLMGGPTGYLETNPQAAFTRFFSPWASGDDAFSRFVRSQYGNTQQGYEAAYASNPELTYQSYLQGLGPGNFSQRWARMNPQQRGESNSLFGGGRVQWIT
jgi:hypothetical protein